MTIDPEQSKEVYEYFAKHEKEQKNYISDKEEYIGKKFNQEVKTLTISNVDKILKILAQSKDSLKTEHYLKQIKQKLKLPVTELRKKLKKYKIEYQKHIAELKRDLKKEENKSYLIDKRFNEPDLIIHIHTELNKTHKLDHREKIAIFMVYVSSELPDPSDHTSAVLKGDSSTGKDSISQANLNHFPEEDTLFVTKATEASVEDDLPKFKRIVFSEVNQFREAGANSHLIELCKQISEGGIKSQKKDVATGYKTTKRIKCCQKTVNYGTTETDIDAEFYTRILTIPIMGYIRKNQIVVNDTLRKSTNPDYYINKFETKESWIAKSIRELNHSLQVIIPFANIFTKPLKDEDGKEKYLFDYTKDRIKRDAKRLLSLTRAITWLYQKQRIVFEKNDKKFILAEPSDFLLALNIFAPYFNLTYQELDPRLLSCLETIKKLVGKCATEITTTHKFSMKYADYVLRDKLQKELTIGSRNTIKDYVKKLKDYGLIDTHYDKAVTNKAYLIRPVSQPAKQVSLPVSLIAIDRSLTGWLQANNIYKQYGKDILQNIPYMFIDDIYKNEKKNLASTSNKLTGQKLTGQFDQDMLPQNLIHHKCVKCDLPESHGWDEKGKPICRLCMNGPDEEVVD